MVSWCTIGAEWHKSFFVSQSSFHFCSFYFVAITASASAAAATATKFAVDPSRSRSVESALAMMATGGGKPNTVTHKGDLSFIKNARNHLDKHALADGLESSLEKTANDALARTLAAMKGSPSAKKRKIAKEIQERKNLTLAEIKELQSMGEEFASPLRDAKLEYHRLRQQLNDLQRVNKNLEKEMEMM